MPAQTPPSLDCRLGVLAFGDSITNGGGELQWGVALQSWAMWVARGLGTPYSGYAVDGARVQEVVHEQIPAFERAADQESRYDLGCLYIGVNDVRAIDWDPNGFERDYRSAMETLSRRSDRLLTATAPLDLGRPRAGAKVRDLNAIIESVAREHGALVTDLSNFKGRNLVMTDHVHPTAFGQIAIAERALETLAAAGLPTKVHPSTLINYETTRWKRLRGDLTYAYRHTKTSVKATYLFAKARINPDGVAPPPPSPRAAGSPAPE
jgi:lysophospholipase L1-like esterase